MAQPASNKALASVLSLIGRKEWPRKEDMCLCVMFDFVNLFGKSGKKLFAISIPLTVMAGNLTHKNGSVIDLRQ